MAEQVPAGGAGLPVADWYGRTVCLGFVLDLFGIFFGSKIFLSISQK